ncbi:MAG: M48 family metallopeptidase [Candidatus Accumulibacter sp.]|jgi:Zn-dependent protease with chaperone function|nr:M48 family metallopeptidase [Accumulibacter sp.]
MEASYFDGRSSRRHPADLEPLPDTLRLSLSTGKRSIPFSHIQISEPQGNAPRTLRFPDGSYCEIPQGPALRELLETIGHRESVVVRLQNRWRWAVFALACVFLALCATYRWGLPWCAKTAAPYIPISLMDKISSDLLDSLDDMLFKPSGLSVERQREITRGFRKLVAADPELLPDQHHLRLYFRNAPELGPNAFTLPGGQIVLLDKFVNLPIGDGEILAVLAHEVGHFRKRHGIQRMIQSSVVGFIAAAYFGDVSVLVPGLYAVLLNSNYSREMEREADDYAVVSLRSQGMAPSLLANALEKLEESHRPDRNKPPGKTSGRRRNDNWFSSHPGTDERIQRSRQADTNPGGGNPSR